MPHVSYFWDEIEDNVVEEFDGDTGATIASYTTEPTLYGSVLSQDRGGEKRCFQFDGQGNTTELTDPSGAVTNMRRYSAFGETTVSTGSTSTPFGFGGRWGYQSNTGTLPLSIRHRSYDRASARWMSADPKLIVSHRYNFVDSRGANDDDPSGLIAVNLISADGYPKTSCHAGIEFVLDFALSKPAPCDGYIVQLNLIRCLHRKCNDCPKADSCTLGWQGEKWIQPPHYAFFEVFFVKKNDYRSKPPKGGHDIRRYEVEDKECGCEQDLAELRFYCLNPKHDPSGMGVGTGNLGNLIEAPPLSAKGWAQGGFIPPQEGAPADICAPPKAGDLPWHGWIPAPDFWSRPPVEKASYWQGIAFNCCECQKNYVNAFGWPLPKVK